MVTSILQQFATFIFSADPDDLHTVFFQTVGNSIQNYTALRPVILLLGSCGSTVGPHWIIWKFWESLHVVRTCVTNTVPWHL